MVEHIREGEGEEALVVLAVVVLDLQQEQQYRGVGVVLQILLYHHLPTFRLSI